MASKPLFTINSVAPIRICDNGGWTDTWFARHGTIFNIAVYPYVEVQIDVYSAHDRRDRITIHAENYGDRYGMHPGQPWEKHPLLEAAVTLMDPPGELCFEATIFSQVPGGASTGTSASVTVALIGALDALKPGRRTAHEMAALAHRVETDLLGLQSGIQDQLCAAYGGINYIDMYAYPHASVSPIQVPNATWWELERSLVLIFLGKSHVSSTIHEMVIKGIENSGPECPELMALRKTAPLSRDALFAGDLVALGKAMIANTQAQANMHPALISEDAQRVIEIAQRYGALGWKVNGAGGDGGSITLLCGPSSSTKRSMIRTIENENALYQNIPLYLSRYGLRVWKT